MLSEIKVARRGLAKSPGFTAIAIVTIATLALAATALLASCIPALRATRADPMLALAHMPNES